MVKSAFPRRADLSALVRLGNELYDLPPDPDVRHQHMLQKLRELLGASVAMSAVVRRGKAFDDLRVLNFTQRGLDQNRQRRIAEEFTKKPTPPSPVRASLVRRAFRSNGPATAFRDQISDDLTWYHSPYMHQWHEPMGIDHGVFSLMRVPGTDLATSITVFRPWGERHRFGPREARLLQLFHSQAHWTFDARARAR